MEEGSKFNHFIGDAQTNIDINHVIVSGKGKIPIHPKGGIRKAGRQALIPKLVSINLLRINVTMHAVP